MLPFGGTSGREGYGLGDAVTICNFFIALENLLFGGCH